MKFTFNEFEMVITNRTTEKPISTPEQAVEFLRRHAGFSSVERFFVVPLDARNAPSGFVLVSQGTLSASLVHPREVFRVAIHLGAAAILIAHNHPSGNVSPSDEDRTITKRLAQAGELLGVRLLDHVIFTDSESYSFADHNPDFLDGSKKGGAES